MGHALVASEQEMDTIYARAINIMPRLAWNSRASQPHYFLLNITFQRTQRKLATFSKSAQHRAPVSWEPSGSLEPCPLKPQPPP